MNNGRFAISVHILTLLAFSEDEWISSEYMAGSININPVLSAQRTIQSAGSRTGDQQGRKSRWKQACGHQGKFSCRRYMKLSNKKTLLGKGINSPNPDCVVGRKINDHLDSLYDDAEKTLLLGLSKTSLADFCLKFA
jgi:hypothetical protein